MTALCYTKPMRRHWTGFTIVELMVVIVVIAILASIVIAVYAGIQDRAQDASRIQDVSKITKSLGVYNARHGDYPNEQGSNWETSYDYPTSFLNGLKTSGVVSGVPVDKVNTVTGGYYRYYLYTAGSYGCDVARGDFYVFEVIKPGGGQSSQSPGFSCSGRIWDDEGWYVTGEYQF